MLLECSLANTCKAALKWIKNIKNPSRTVNLQFPRLEALFLLAKDL